MKNFIFSITFLILSSKLISQTSIGFAPVNDTIQADSYENAMNQIFGQLPYTHYPSGFLFNKVAVPGKMLFACGVLSDTAFNMGDWFFIQNMARKAYRKSDSIIDFVKMDSLRKKYIIENNILPLGIVNIEGQVLNDSALLTGELQIQGHRFVENTVYHHRIYKNRRLFSVCPLNIEIYTMNPQLIITDQFILSNSISNLTKMEIDLDDDKGFQEVFQDIIFQANYTKGGFKNILTRFIYNNRDTIFSRSYFFVYDSPDFEKLSNNGDGPDAIWHFSPNEDDFQAIEYPEEFSDFPYDNNAFEDDAVSFREVEVGVYYACRNGNYEKKIRKPMLLLGGYNPKNGKALTPNGHGFDFNTSVGKMLGIHGWRGIYYQMINGEYVLYSKNSQPSYTQTSVSNGNNLIEKLRNEGYDILILRFRDGVGLIEHNAFLTTLAIKAINRSILNETDGVENPGAALDPEAAGYPITSTKLKKAKHELVVQGYSAGALCSRMALLLMEYENEKKGCNTLYPAHRVKTWVAYEHESQGSNTPIGQQMFWDFQKSLEFIPNNVGDFLLSFISDQALKLLAHRGVSTQNTLYQVTNISSPNSNNWIVGHSTDFDKYFAHLSAITPNHNPVNLIGYPLKCYRIGVSNGNANGINQTNGGTTQMLDHISPTSWCTPVEDPITYYTNVLGTWPSYLTKKLLDAALPPGVSFHPYREAHARYLNSWNDNALKTKFGITIQTFIYSWHINIGHWKYYSDNHIQDAVLGHYQNYDDAHGSNLASHLIFGDGLTKIPFGLSNLLLHRTMGMAAVTNCNYFDYSNFTDGFASTSSLLDLHQPGQNGLPRLPDLSIVPGNTNGGLNLMKQNNYIGQGIQNNSPNGEFGYPHLTYPNNHYDYTPYDAIWANTTNNAHYDDNYLHVEDPNPLISQFLVEEIAPPNLYLSNRTIEAAYHTCNGQIMTEKYYADFEARNSVRAGNETIYQNDNPLPQIWYQQYRTASGDFVIEKDAIVTIRANNENGTSSVTLGPGFSSKFGSIFRAYVFRDPNMCSAFSAKPASETKLNNEQNAYSEYSIPIILNKRANTQYYQKNNSMSLKSVVGVFPNPSSGYIYFSLPKTEVYNYEVKDVWGRKLEEGILQDKLDLSKFTKGVYFISISSASIKQTDRIIIQ